MNALADSVPGLVSAAAEVQRALLVSAGLLALLLTAELWRRFGRPPAEWTRKFVHFTAGIIVATLPWVLRSPWTVLALGIAFAAVMAVTRRFGLLRSIHGIDRASEGVLCYPLAVCLLFFIGHRQPVFYLVAALALVISDTLAALLGSVYGRWSYPVETGRRTIEGSVVFFLATFLCVYVPLLLLTHVDRTASLLIAAQVALLVTCLEAISLRGTDNLIVPLSTYYLMVKLAPNSVGWIAGLLIAQVGILFLMGVVARLTRCLTLSGAIAAHLVVYAALALGGPRWTVAPALTLAILVTLDSLAGRTVRRPRVSYQVTVVFYLSIVSVLLLAASNLFSTLLPLPPLSRESETFYGAFVGAFAAQLAIVGPWLQGRLGRPRRHPPRRSAAVWTVFAFLAVAPLSLSLGVPRLSLPAAVAAAGVGLLGPAIHHGLRRLGEGGPDRRISLRLQAASVALAAAAVLCARLGWAVAF